MDHPKFTAFIAALEALFHEADEALEEKWGTRFSLHPNRPRRGETGIAEDTLGIRKIRVWPLTNLGIEGIR
ncbi:MAG: hypothetical protein LBG25_06630 [Spirochaetaceae bacterium]|nr:hypothetical protein [Spirochaetaceae bacterium]